MLTISKLSSYVGIEVKFTVFFKLNNTYIGFKVRVPTRMCCFILYLLDTGR